MIEKKQNTYEYLLLFTALLLIAFRFFYLSYASYITDEPATQMIVDKVFASGEFPFTLFRGSQVHVPYGAGALWFYMFLRLFTWNPLHIAYAHTTLFCMGFLFLYLAMKNSAGKKVAIWSLLFASSSPFLFDLSRHTWDVTFFIPFGGLLLWLVSLLDTIKADTIQNKNKGRILIIAISIVAAYLVNIHLMGIPLVGAAGLVVFWFLYKSPIYSNAEKIKWAFLFCLTFVILIAPYTYAAWKRWVEEPMNSNVVRNKAWGDSRNLWWLFIRSTMYSSTWFTKFYFDPYVADFRAFTDPVFAFFHKTDIFGWFAKIATYGYLIRKSYHFIIGKQSTHVSLFAVLIFLIFLTMMQYSNIPTDAHHYAILWWIVFWASTRVRNILPGIWKRLYSGILLANIFINIAFCAYYIGFIKKNHGVRNPVISTALKDQIEKIEEGCNWMSKNDMAVATWDVSKVGLVQHPFIYMVKHIPACAGKSVTISTWNDPQTSLVLDYKDKVSSPSAELEWSFIL
ncbi:MAG: hypothetical protein M9962_07700 [Oligoflexia bacterium]|nr:hypothetical protein [Oligoflexia bacterium]